MKAWPTCLLVSGLLCAASAGEVRLRFTRAAEMPDSGLRLLLPAGAVADPLPPPAIMDGYREVNGSRQRLELLSPLEVWRWKQREGRWVDERGNKLILASATLPAPEWQVDWLPRDEVNRLLAGKPQTGRAWSPADLARWLGFFWGVPDMKAEPLGRKQPFAMAEAFLFRKTVPGPGLACAFRLKSGSEGWRFVLLEPARETGTAVAEQAFVEDLLPSIQFIGRRAAPSTAFPPGSAMSAKPLTPREESLRRARESIRNMKGWWAVEGAHTVVLSNIKSGKSQLVDAILEDLEALRPTWETVAPPWEAEREVAVVRVFGTPEDYVRYVGPEQAWTSGIWVPSRRELVIRPLEEGSVLRNRRAMLATVYHEAFHQYLDEAFGRVQAAPWFNEGFAQLFSCVSLSARRVRIERDPGPEQVLGGLARSKQLDLAPLFKMDYPEFYGRDEAARRAHYALAWGLMYFLQEGGRKSEPWRGLPARYSAALRETRNPAEATTRALTGVNMTALNEAFLEFWK